MAWNDREDGANENPFGRVGRPGGDWQGVRPSLDNPMSWSVRLARVSGIVVRIHILFILIVVIQLLQALFAKPTSAQSIPLDFHYVAIALGCLFLIVLAHEFGHCLACRLVDGEADEILMWPLGGLAYCRPPQRWRAHFITAAGGPLVNVLFLIVAAPMLGLITGRWWGVAIPNPFDFSGLLYVAHSWPLAALYLFNEVNLIILLFNILVPMFPMDGGRLMQALLWSKIGYMRSMRIALRVGYVAAILLGVLGLVLGPQYFMLVFVAVFGGLTCWQTHKQLQFTEQFMGGTGDDEYSYALQPGLAPDEEDAEERPRKPTRAERKAAREAEIRADRARQADVILEKISKQGMESLTSKEKQLLEQARQDKLREQ